MKHFIKAIIFVLVEAYFLIKASWSELETFFFFWIFFYMALFLYNTFSSAFEGSAMSSTGLDKGNIENVRNQHRDNTGGGRINSVTTGLKDAGNYLYLGLAILNVIGYMIVMP